MAAAWSDTLKTQHRDGKASMTSSVLQWLGRGAASPRPGHGVSLPNLDRFAPKLTTHLFSAQGNRAENR